MCVFLVDSVERTHYIKKELLVISLNSSCIVLEMNRKAASREKIINGLILAQIRM